MALPIRVRRWATFSAPRSRTVPTRSKPSLTSWNRSGPGHDRGLFSDCRPGERRDPCRVIYVMGALVVTAFFAKPGLWLWVSAFAGTTDGGPSFLHIGSQLML